MLRRPLAHALADPASCISSAQLGATPTDDLAKRRGVGMNLYMASAGVKACFFFFFVSATSDVLAARANFPGTRLVHSKGCFVPITTIPFSLPTSNT